MRRTALFLSVFALALALASCSGGTKESEPSGSSTPETSAQSSPSIEAQSVDMLVGTWTGEMTEPDVAAWTMKVTIGPCDSAGLCGEYTYRTQSWYTTERPAVCGGTLTYERMRDPSETGPDHSFVFQEADVWGRGGVEEYGRPADVCGIAEMVLTPMPDFMGLGIQEEAARGFIDYGLLRLCTTC